MKTQRSQFGWRSLVAFCAAGCMVWPGRALAESIFWQHKSVGNTAVWIMNGTTRVGSGEIVPEIFFEWQMVAAGDFGSPTSALPDGKTDIVWRHQGNGMNGIWYMDGLTRIGSALFQTEPHLDWQIEATGDFDRDGKTDLLWRHKTNGSNAVWYMDGAIFRYGQFIESLGGGQEFLDWEIVGAGDFGSPTGVPDGKVDILWRHRTSASGLNAVWYMDLPANPNKIGSTLIPSNTDLDYKIVGAGHYNGDGKIDILWRHATLGLNAVWFMDGINLAGSTFIDPNLDTDWKAAGQDRDDSFWRVQRMVFPKLNATVSASPPQITLNFSIPVRSTASGGVTIRRRVPGQSTWTTKASNQTSTWMDTDVQVGLRYEYELYRENQFIPQTRYYLSTGVNAAAIESRGRLILLADNTLAGQLAVELTQLEQDLVGDGWTVIRRDVDRHSDTDWPSNPAKIAAIKAEITSIYNQNPSQTKAIFIVGHVAVPYSGVSASDGHVSCLPDQAGPNHQGAWAADIFYADLNGAWSDTVINFDNCDFVESDNQPGDGKYDPDDVPNSPLALELAVGRIDFARLPAFGVNPPAESQPDPKEVELLKQYLNKNHRYRHKLLSWQSQSPENYERAIVYDHFADKSGFNESRVYDHAGKNASSLFGDQQGKLMVGNVILNRTKSYLLGFVGGPGKWDRINDSIQFLEVTSMDLAAPGGEPGAVFYAIRASYLGDWNLTTNNFLRSILASGPNFGLATMWFNLTSPWRLQTMAMGEYLGSALVHLMNNPSPDTGGDQDRRRDLTILGDPTLRLHVLTPPSNLTASWSGSSIVLNWGPGESGGQYYVYRSSSLNGPFTRISVSPVDGTSFTDAMPPSGAKVYLVRTLKLATSGSGSYINLSQGAFSQRVKSKDR